MDKSRANQYNSNSCNDTRNTHSTQVDTSRFPVTRTGTEAKVPATDSRDIRTLISNASVLFQHKAYDKALEALNKAKKIQFSDHSMNIEILSARAIVLYEVKGYKQILSDVNNATEMKFYNEHYNASKTISPIRVITIFGSEANYSYYDQSEKSELRRSKLMKSIALVNLNKHDKALNDLNEILEENPNDILALSTRAEALHQLKKHDEALNDLNKALEKDPHDIPALSTRASILYNLKNYNEALNDLNDLNKLIDRLQNYKFLRPIKETIYITEARVLYNLKKYDEAQESFNKGYNPPLDDKNKNLLLIKASILYNLKNYNEALNDLNKLNTISDNYDPAVILRSMIQYNLKNHNEALKTLNEALDKNPNKTSILDYKGKLLSHLKRYREAAENFTNMLNLEPNNISILVNRAKTFYNLEEFDKSLNDLNKALSKDQLYKSLKSYKDAYHYRGKIHIHNENWDEALQDLNTAIYRSELDWKQNSNAVESPDLSNHPQENHYPFPKSSSLLNNPMDSSIYQDIGYAYFNQKEFVKAKRNFDRSIHLNPTNSFAYAYRAQVYDALGDSISADTDRENCNRLNSTNYPMESSTIFDIDRLSQLKDNPEGDEDISQFSESLRSLTVTERTKSEASTNFLKRYSSQMTADSGAYFEKPKKHFKAREQHDQQRTDRAPFPIPSEQTCAHACQRLKSAWDEWKKTFRESHLNSLDPDTYLEGNDEALENKNKLKYSEANPTAFFAHVVMYGKLPFQQNNGNSGEFTTQDLVYAMDPRFKKYGHQFLQSEWRVTEGSSWIGGKKYRPGESIPPGDQRREGQHEWIPTATTTRVLHTVLQHYSKQEQLAWISALDIFRTETSSVAIGCTWNPKYRIQDVNANPGQYRTSQLFIWEHHSAGMYSPQQQLNKGNGPFHDQINKLIDHYLTPNKSQLPELLEALKDFTEHHLFDGKLPANLGLSQQAMEQIPNDLTRQSQKTYSTAERYGRYDHASELMEIDDNGKKETLGYITFQNAQTLAKLLDSFAETKQRTLEIFEHRINAIKSYTHLDINSYLAGLSFDLGTDELTTQAFLSQLQGEYKTAEQLWSNVHKNLTNQWGEEALFTEWSTFMRATLYRQMGDYDKAAGFLEQSLSITKQKRSQDQETRKRYLELAELHIEFNQYQNAIRTLKEVLTIHEQLPQSEQDPSILKSKLLLASTYIETNQLDAASSLLNESEKTFTSLEDTQSPDKDPALLLHYLHYKLLSTKFQEKTGVYDRNFETQIQKALNLSKDLKEIPLTTAFLGEFISQRGKYYMHKQAYDQAEQAIQEALALYQEYPEMNWQKIAQSTYQLGQLYEKQQQYQQAEESYLHAHTLYYQAADGIQIPFQTEIIQSLTSLYKKQGKQEELKLFVENIDLEKNKERVSSQVAHLCKWVSSLHIQWDNYEKAEQLLKNAFRISKRNHGKEHPDTRRICQELIQFYIGQTEYKKAKPWTDYLWKSESGTRQGALSLLTIDLVAHVYTHLGKYKQAMTLYQTAFDKLMTPSKVSSNAKAEHINASSVPLKETYKKYIYENKLAKLYLLQGDISQAEQLLKPIISIYEANEETRKKIPSLERASVYNNLGICYQQKGSEGYKKAKELFQQALTILGEKDTIETVQTHLYLGQLYKAESKFAEAEQALKQAQHILSRKFRTDHLTTAEIYLEQCLLHLKQHQYDQVEEALAEVNRIYEKKLGSDYAMMSRVSNGYGWLYQELGHYTQAEPWVQESHELTETQYGINHPFTATSLRNLGKLHILQGKYQEATEELEASYQILEQEPKENSPSLALTLINLGLLHHKQKHHEKAQEYLERALTIRKTRDSQSNTTDHPITLECKGHLASVYIDLGKLDEAKNLLQEVHHMWEQKQQFQSNIPTFQQYSANILLNLSRLYRKQRMYPEATSFLEETENIFEKQYNPNYLDRARVYLQRGELAEAQKNHKEASIWYQAALYIQIPKLGENHPETQSSKELLMQINQQYNPPNSNAVESPDSSNHPQETHHLLTITPTRIESNDTQKRRTFLRGLDKDFFLELHTYTQNRYFASNPKAQNKVCRAQDLCHAIKLIRRFGRINTKIMEMLINKGFKLDEEHGMDYAIELKELLNEIPTHAYKATQLLNQLNQQYQEAELS